MSEYTWPALFAVTFVSATLAGIFLARQRAAQGQPLYFRSAAVVESLVAIASGVLLWMGVWDLLDEYLVPQSWWYMHIHVHMPSWLSPYGQTLCSDVCRGSASAVSAGRSCA